MYCSVYICCVEGITRQIIYKNCLSFPVVYRGFISSVKEPAVSNACIDVCNQASLVKWAGQLLSNEYRGQLRDYYPAQWGTNQYLILVGYTWLSARNYWHNGWHRMIRKSPCSFHIQQIVHHTMVPISCYTWCRAQILLCNQQHRVWVTSAIFCDQ